LKKEHDAVKLRLEHVIAVLVLGACVLPATALGKEDSSKNLVSKFREIRPPVAGLTLSVADRDRFLDLRNGTGKTVLVKGYDNEPYLRFLANRRVDVNARSPSKYVNEDRFGRTPVPAVADSKARPRWQPVANGGEYRWFDHRIHYMAQGTPPEVKDPGKRAKVFDWSVPMVVGGQPARALGSLTWDPGSGDSSGSSAWVVIAIAAAVAVALALLALLGLRRRRSAVPGPAGEKRAEEAW
jgi:hypothetical protein